MKKNKLEIIEELELIKIRLDLLKDFKDIKTKDFFSSELFKDTYYYKWLILNQRYNKLRAKLHCF